MGYSLRNMPAERKFSSELTLEALSHAIPPAVITAVLVAEAAQEQRERKLTMAVVMLVLIAMNLYPERAIDDVLRKLAQGLRFIWPDPDLALPTAGALS